MKVASLLAESTQQVPSVQKRSPQVAVAILRWFPDMGTGMEHALHLNMPLVNILHQCTVGVKYAVPSWCLPPIDYGR